MPTLPSARRVRGGGAWIQLIGRLLACLCAGLPATAGLPRTASASISPSPFTGDSDRKPGRRSIAPNAIYSIIGNLLIGTALLRLRCSVLAGIELGILLHPERHRSVVEESLSREPQTKVIGKTPHLSMDGDSRGAGGDRVHTIRSEPPVAPFVAPHRHAMVGSVSMGCLSVCHGRRLSRFEMPVLRLAATD
jgi:hypothetical protein